MLGRAHVFKQQSRSVFACVVFETQRLSGLHMQACLAVAELKDEHLGDMVSSERLQDCVNVILSYQNSDGGWATYENTRSYSALEVRMTPSSV